MPKMGFRSAMKASRAEVTLGALARIAVDPVDLKALIDANIVPADTVKAKVILSGKLDKAVTLKGLAVTKGARAAIEAAGGRIEE
jgi:large subunit ribosomal protein L15